MNNNVKALHYWGYATNRLVMLRIKNIVLHKLGPETGML